MGCLRRNHICTIAFRQFPSYSMVPCAEIGDTWYYFKILGANFWGAGGVPHRDIAFSMVGIESSTATWKGASECVCRLDLGIWLGVDNGMGTQY